MLHWVQAILDVGPETIKNTATDCHSTLARRSSKRPSYHNVPFFQISCAFVLVQYQYQRWIELSLACFNPLSVGSILVDFMSLTKRPAAVLP
jgi:hypothetical protein